MKYKHIIEHRFFFRDLMEANTSGVFALVNDKDRKVYIAASSNVMKALGVLVSEIANNTTRNKALYSDRQKIQLRLLEQTTALIPAKLKWLTYYQEQGFSFYNIEKFPRYTVKVVTLEKGLLEVRLVSAGKRFKVIKQFARKDECEKYIKETPVWNMLKK